jgi:O-antigen/teichoic acid export membrane protein
VGLLQATRRFDLINAAQVPLGVGQFLLPLLCGLWWPNLAFVVGVLLLSRLLGVAVLLWFATRVFPDLWAARRYDAAEAKALFRFGGWVTVSSIVSPLMVYADRFLLGNLRSLAAVSHYSVPSDAATRLLIIPRSLVPALYPVFSSASEPDARSQLAARGLKFILVFVGVPVVPLIVLAPELMTFWMGADFARSSALALRILLVGVVFNALAYVPLSLTQAVGRADVTARIHLAELPVYAFVAYVAIRHGGPAGAAAAWALRTISDLAALLWMARRVAKLSFRQLLGQRLPTMALTLVASAFVGVATTSFLSAVPWKVLTAALLGSCAAAVSWRICLTADDRQRLINLVRGHPPRDSAFVSASEGK